MIIRTNCELVLNLTRFTGELTEQRKANIILEVERKINQIGMMECDAVGKENVGIRLHIKGEKE